MMKQLKVIFIAALVCGSATLGKAQSPSIEITRTVEAFYWAGDYQDADKLGKLLHQEFRVVMNQLFGSSELSVMSRKVYVEKIRAKEFGGDERTIQIESIQFNGKHALVRVLAVGKAMTMRSDLLLVQEADKGWKLLSDTPTILE